MREMTIRTILLGCVLAIVLGAANAYMGLYVGLTVSASIPAAVISMALLRGLFRTGSIQENNIVQSIASAGESLAAGVIFTVPALVLIGVWKEFQFWPTTLIALSGGILGIIFMVPLRKALVVDQKDLAFPEGTACAAVLEAGDTGGSGLRAIFFGAILGFIFKLLAAWAHVLRGTIETAFSVGRRVFYPGMDMSPALLGVGYIVKLEIAALIFLGGLIGTGFFLPLLSDYHVSSGLTPLEYAHELSGSQVRYIGVGAMLIGGLYSILLVRAGISAGMRGLLEAGRKYRNQSGGMNTVSPDSQEVERQAEIQEERRRNHDIPLTQLLIGLMIVMGLTFYLYDSLIGDAFVALVVGVAMIVVAFLFVAVAAYIVGLVGSSNSPVTGMTISALLMTSGVVLVLGLKGDQAALAVLGIAGLVCCSACTSGDIAQDLKTGSLVGATPSKQQYGEILGVIVAAPIFAAVLNLLHQSYGIGTGEPGALKAPQSALFAGLTKALVGDEGLPLLPVATGVGVGLAIIILDWFLKYSGSRFRAHVMPMAVGIYLPLSLSVAIFLGGLLRYAGDRVTGRHSETDNGVLFGSGLIAGESIAGIIGGILLLQNIAPDSIWPTEWQPFATALTFVALAGIGFMYFHYARKDDSTR
ncbi:MAG: oligopeptide transporter, OPT family [Leptospiraceae bacterium]|nr:oligopeptide transporter, OPT family [Leptospiraceae bacterium]